MHHNQLVRQLQLQHVLRVESKANNRVAFNLVVCIYALSNFRS